MLCHLNCAPRFDLIAVLLVVVGSWDGRAAEYLIEGSKKRICRLSFEFWSLHVTERRSNIELWTDDTHASLMPVLLLFLSFFRFLFGTINLNAFQFRFPIHFRVKFVY